MRRRPTSIAIPTFLATILTGLGIWLVAGPPPHPPKRANAHQLIVSVK